MIRVLFVCLGNICRSPMAEFVMRDMVRRRGLESEFQIASAATSSEEVGNPVYPPVRELLARHGLDCAGKTARQITARDYGQFDYIIGMDEANIRSLRRLFRGDPEEKVSLLLDHVGEHRDVADPWYTRDFETAWRDVNRACAALLEELI